MLTQLVQGFTTTKTTELNSVGQAVQVVALFIGGAITLNIPNCQSSPSVHSHPDFDVHFR